MGTRFNFRRRCPHRSTGRSRRVILQHRFSFGHLAVQEIADRRYDIFLGGGYLTQTTNMPENETGDDMAGLFPAANYVEDRDSEAIAQPKSKRIP
jgi:hypothetical protein